jgi:hypothetical protein
MSRVDDKTHEISPATEKDETFEVTLRTYAPSVMHARGASGVVFQTASTKAEPLRINVHEDIRVNALAPSRRLPGSWMLSIASLATKKDREQIFEPMIAELQHEYAELLGKGERPRAEWIRVVYVYKFVAATPLLRLLTWLGLI